MRNIVSRLDSILDYVAKLNAVDTSNVEPMTQVAADVAAWRFLLEIRILHFREDVVVPCDISREVLERAPDADGALF